MKVRRKVSRKDREILEQQVYDISVETCEDNNATLLIALNEAFGFGTERLNRAIEAFSNVSERFREMRETGYTDEDVHKRIVEELNQLGIAEEQIYTGHSDFAQAHHYSKMIKKNERKVTFAESVKAQQHMVAMKEYLNDPEPLYLRSTAMTSDAEKIIEHKKVKHIHP